MRCPECGENNWEYGEKNEKYGFTVMKCRECYTIFTDRDIHDYWSSNTEPRNVAYEYEYEIDESNWDEAEDGILDMETVKRRKVRF